MPLLARVGFDSFSCPLKFVHSRWQLLPTAAPPPERIEPESDLSNPDAQAPDHFWRMRRAVSGLKIRITRYTRNPTTAIFCLIFAWNEYAFAVLLTSGTAQTAPPFIPIIIGEGAKSGGRQSGAERALHVLGHRDALRGPRHRRAA